MLVHQGSFRDSGRGGFQSHVTPRYKGLGNTVPNLPGNPTILWKGSIHFSGYIILSAVLICQLITPRFPKSYFMGRNKNSVLLANDETILCYTQSWRRSVTYNKFWRFEVQNLFCLKSCNTVIQIEPGITFWTSFYPSEESFLMGNEGNAVSENNLPTSQPAQYFPFPLCAPHGPTESRWWFYQKPPHWRAEKLCVCDNWYIPAWDFVKEENATSSVPFWTDFWGALRNEGLFLIKNWLCNKLSDTSYVTI